MTALPVVTAILIITIVKQVEIKMQPTDTRGFTIENFEEFNREISPTVPPEFPHEKMPSKY